MACRKSVVITSSTEAEYITCSEAAKEALWLRRVMTEICGTPTMEPTEYSHESEAWKIVEILLSSQSPSERPIPAKEPQIIFADNQGAIQLSKNPQHHNRTKHIDVKYHFIRESCQQGLIQLVHIPTNEIVADILTKSLPRDKHEKHMKGMGMMDSVGVRWGSL